MWLLGCLSSTSLPAAVVVADNLAEELDPEEGVTMRQRVLRRSARRGSAGEAPQPSYGEAAAEDEEEDAHSGQLSPARTAAEGLCSMPPCKCPVKNAICLLRRAIHSEVLITLCEDLNRCKRISS